METDIVPVMRAYGFRLSTTGGGLTAYLRTVGGGTAPRVEQLVTAEGPDGAPTYPKRLSQRVTLGVYDADTGEQLGELAEFPSVGACLAYVDAVAAAFVVRGSQRDATP